MIRLNNVNDVLHQIMVWIFEAEAGTMFKFSLYSVAPPDVPNGISV